MKRLLAMGLLTLVLGACSASLPGEAEVRGTPPDGLPALEGRLQALTGAHPEDAGALRLLALVQLRLGKLPAAERNARKAAAAEPFRAATLETLGRVYLARNNLLAALSAFEQAARLEPELTAAQTGQALANEHLGHSGKALKILALAVRRAPRDFEARYHQARLLARQGSTAAALTAIEAARVAAPGSQETLLLHVDILRVRGEHGRARLLIGQGLEQWPGDPGLLTALLHLHREREEWEAARGVLSRLEQAGPPPPWAVLLAAEIDLGQGRKEAARTRLEALAGVRPPFAPGLTRLGRLLVEQGQPAAALRWLEQAAAHGPEDPEPHYWMAAAHLARNDPGMAGAALSDLERLQPGARAAGLLRTVMLLRAGRADAAEARLAAAVPADSKDPGDPKNPAVSKDSAALLLRAALQCLRGRLSEAGRTLERVNPAFNPDELALARMRLDFLAGRHPRVLRAPRTLRRHPRLGWRAAYLRAEALWRTGSGGEAQGALAPYLTGSAPSPRLHYLAGYLALLRGDRDGAERIFSDGLSRFAGEPILLEGLSQAYLLAGQWGEARRVLERGLNRPGAHRELFRERLAAVARGEKSGTRQALRAFLAESGQPRPGGAGATMLGVLYGWSLPPYPHPGRVPSALLRTGPAALKSEVGR